MNRQGDSASKLRSRGMARRRKYAGRWKRRIPWVAGCRAGSRDPARECLSGGAAGGYAHGYRWLVDTDSGEHWQASLRWERLCLPESPWQSAETADLGRQRGMALPSQITSGEIRLAKRCGSSLAPHARRVAVVDYGRGLATPVSSRSSPLETVTGVTYLVDLSWFWQLPCGIITP